MAAIINLTGWNNPDVWIFSIILKSKRFNQFWDGSSHRFDVWTPIFDGQLPICYTNQSVSPNASGCYTMISLFWSSRLTSLAQPVGLPGKSPGKSRQNWCTCVAFPIQVHDVHVHDSYDACLFDCWCYLWHHTIVTASQLVLPFTASATPWPMSLKFCRVAAAAMSIWPAEWHNGDSANPLLHFDP